MKNPLRALGILLSAILVIAVTCWPFQILWNLCFVGAVDGVNAISYGRAVGIVFMFGLLFFGAIAMFSLFTVRDSSDDESQE